MYWKNKKVLVTGGGGVIGRELIKKLVSRESEVVCLDRVEKPEDIADIVEYHLIDISELEPEDIAAFQPEVIMHLAAAFERTEETPEFWDENYRDNVVVSHKVIEAAKMCNQLECFVFASSYLIYSPELYLFEHPPNEPKKLTENDKIDPRNLCGAAKYYAEKELEFIDLFNDKFRCISARIHRVYGRGSRDIISRWIRAGIRGETIDVFMKENSFGYIFAGDVAEGLIRLAETKDACSIVNLGGEKFEKIKDVISILKGEIPALKIRKTKKNELYEASCSDNSRLYGLTGWKPDVTLEKGLKKIIDYESKILIGK